MVVNSRHSPAIAVKLSSHLKPNPLIYHDLWGIDTYDMMYLSKDSLSVGAYEQFMTLVGHLKPIVSLLRAMGFLCLTV